MKYRVIICLLIFVLLLAPLQAAGGALSDAWLFGGNSGGQAQSSVAPETIQPVIAPAKGKGPEGCLSLPLNLNFLFRTGLVFQSGVSPQQLKTGLLSESPAGECVREADLLCDFTGGHFAALPSGFHLLLKE